MFVCLLGARGLESLEMDGKKLPSLRATIYHSDGQGSNPILISDWLRYGFEFFFCLEVEVLKP